MNRRSTQLLIIASMFVAGCMPQSSDVVATSTEQPLAKPNLESGSNELSPVRPQGTENELDTYNPNTVYNIERISDSDYTFQFEENGILLTGGLLCPTPNLCDQLKDVNSGELSKRVTGPDFYTLPDGSTILLSENTYYLYIEEIDKVLVLELMHRSIALPGGYFVVMHITEGSKGDKGKNDYASLQADYMLQYL